jgi:DNA-directed RNA polymerase subunit L
MVESGLEQIYANKKKSKPMTELAHDLTGKTEVRITPVMVKHGDEQIAVDLWNLVIKGETHTIGELLVNHINHLDPDIPFVSPKMDHLRDNQITIQVIHPTPEKITLDAIKQCIIIFENLIKQANAYR